jgi:hypothetical protein
MVTPELELAPPAFAPEPAGRADVVVLDSPPPELQHAELKAPGNERVEAGTAVPVDVAGK